MISVLIGICAFLIVWAWPETTLFCIVYGILVLIGNAHPEFMGKLIGYGFLALVAYAVIASLCAALWRHIKGSSAPVQPLSQSHRPKAIRGRIPRDLLLKSER